MTRTKDIETKAKAALQRAAATRAEEAQAYTLSLIRGMTLPATTMTWALASAQIAAPRISQALKALVRRRVIRAESYRFIGATYWRIDGINPETQWKPR